jgi:hypothetical protein
MQYVFFSIQIIQFLFIFYIDYNFHI